MQVLKKNRTKIPKENKIRAELQKEISSICPYCDSTDVGHFEIHHIDEDPSNNDKLNLILLCPTCHSKITKGDITQSEVYKKKLELISKPQVAQKRRDLVLSVKGKKNTTVVGDNNKVTIRQTSKTVKEKYPEGCIGHDVIKANYIGHLIGRYNEYKSIEIGKDNIKYGIFAGHLKKKFKIGPSRTIYNLSLERFEELVEYIQNRIISTMFAKTKGKSHKHFSSYEEYHRIQTQKKIEPGVYIYNDNKYAIYDGSTLFFEGRLSDTFPGLRGLRVYENSTEAVSKLEILLKKPLKFDYSAERAFTDPIWWERGFEGNLQIEDFERLSSTKCVINIDEYEVDRIAVYRSVSRYRNFVYVEVNAEQPTGIYKSLKQRTLTEVFEDGRFPKEEYAIFKGRVISRQEYDDGSAEIDGKVVEVWEHAKLRVRCLSPYNFIIAAKASVFNCEPIEEKNISLYLNKLLLKEIELQKFIDYIENLPLNRFGLN